MRENNIQEIDNNKMLKQTVAQVTTKHKQKTPHLKTIRYAMRRIVMDQNYTNTVCFQFNFRILVSFFCFFFLFRFLLLFTFISFELFFLLVKSNTREEEAIKNEYMLFVEWSMLYMREMTKDRQVWFHFVYLHLHTYTKMYTLMKF